LKINHRLRYFKQDTTPPFGSLWKIFLTPLSVVELKAYELGDLAVTLGAFENFASKYRLPQATLFALTAPDEPPKPTDFRTIEGKKAQQSFDFGIR
jgi:hypothetical protein